MNTVQDTSFQWQALLVDDERPARKRLSTLLTAHPEIAIAGEARDLVSARALLRELRPQLVFLDIQLSPGNGFDLLPDIPKETHIIFVTAHDRFAVRAFEANALDYLLKPVLPQRLASSLARLRQHAPTSSPNHPPQRMQSEDFLILRDGKVWRRIAIASIAAVLGDGTYTRVLATDGSSLLTLKTLSYWTSTLPEQPFVKLSRSLIVNLTAIQKSHFKNRNHANLWLDGHEHPLSLGRVALRQLRQHWQTD